MKKINNKIYCLVGSTASGKTYLGNKLMETGDFNLLVSVTTRVMREGEVDGLDYYYLDNDAFDELVSTNSFAEYSSYNIVKGSISDKSVVRYGLTTGEIESKTDDKPCIVVVNPDGYEELALLYGKDMVKMIHLVPSNDGLRRKHYFKRIKLVNMKDRAEFNRRADIDKVMYSGLDYDLCITNEYTDLSLSFNVFKILSFVSRFK